MRQFETLLTRYSWMDSQGIKALFQLQLLRLTKWVVWIKRHFVVPIKTLDQKRNGTLLWRYLNLPGKDVII
jgi:hypothetical protein